MWGCPFTFRLVGEMLESAEANMSASAMQYNMGMCRLWEQPEKRGKKRWEVFCSPNKTIRIVNLFFSNSYLSDCNRRVTSETGKPIGNADVCGMVGPEGVIGLAELSAHRDLNQSWAIE